MFFVIIFNDFIQTSDFAIRLKSFVKFELCNKTSNTADFFLRLCVKFHCLTLTQFLNLASESSCSLILKRKIQKLSSMFNIFNKI